MSQTHIVREIIDQYQAATGATIYQAREVARWAVQRRLWREREDIVDRCADAIARVLREEVLPNGVRTKHAVRINRGTQLTLWADMRTAPREHMELAFRQRREQIAADCHRLAKDIDFYNKHYNSGVPIQLSFDLRQDMVGRSLPTMHDY
jgi:hypothetical protein